jgi:hypothetical protein
VQQHLAAELACVRLGDRERDRAALAQLAALVPQALAHVLLAGVLVEAEEQPELVVGLERGRKRLDVIVAQRPQNGAVAGQPLGPADGAASRRQPLRSPVA